MVLFTVFMPFTTAGRESTVYIADHAVQDFPYVDYGGGEEIGTRTENLTQTSIIISRKRITKDQGR